MSTIGLAGQNWTVRTVSGGTAEANKPYYERPPISTLLVSNLLPKMCADSHARFSESVKEWMQESSLDGVNVSYSRTCECGQELGSGLSV